MTTIAELRSALQTIPDALLGPDESIVRDEALTSLDALSMFDVVPVAVTFVGSSGSGKSLLVNRCVGADVSPTSVIRPTTTRVLMAGSSGPVSLSVESDYAHVPDARGGVVFIDTPSWEHDEDAVIAAMDVADLVVVVLTPSRYADAAVARLVERLPQGRPSAVVLNRVDASEEDRHRLSDSVSAIYGADVVALDEGGDVHLATEQLLEGLEIDTFGYQRAAVLRSSAASGARHLAGAVTSLSTDIGRLAEQVEARSTDADDVVFSVLASWPESRAAVAQDVVRRIEGIDAALSSGDIGARVRSGLETVDGGRTAAEFDRWKSVLDDRCIASATIRWRRKAAHALVESHAWRVGLNPALDAPPRLRRILKGQLDAIAETAHAEAVDMVAMDLSTRISEWQTAVGRLGTYAPGVLLDAADGFSPRGDRTGG